MQVPAIYRPYLVGPIDIITGIYSHHVVWQNGTAHLEESLSAEPSAVCLRD